MSNSRNLANAIVLTAPSPATSGTTLVLDTGYGAAMPATPFSMTLSPPRQLSTLGNSEIVTVTNVSTDTLTIVRAQKGTTAKSVASGWVAVNGIYTEDINSFNSFVSDETPSGTIDGANKVFITSSPYVGATLEVFVNGLKQKRTTHYIETTPTSGTFTFDDAPSSGDVVTVNYSFGSSASTNSDTIDGFHAASTPTANTIPVLDSNGKMPPTSLGGNWTSWTPTWTNLTGGTLQYAKYVATGKTIRFRIAYTLSGAGVSGGIRFTFPVTAHSDYAARTTNAEPIGDVIIRDSGTAFFFGHTSLVSTTLGSVRVISTSGTYPTTTETNTTVPHTWANTDEIYIEGTYEAA